MPEAGKLVLALLAVLGFACLGLGERCALAHQHWPRADGTSVSRSPVSRTRPTLWQAFQQGGRAVCEGKPVRRKGLSRRLAVIRRPSSAPSPCTSPPAAPAAPGGQARVAPGEQASPHTQPGTGADIKPPDTSITRGPAATVSTTTVSFAFSSSESGSTFECKRDNGAWRACISPKGYSSLAAGAHAFSVRAIDAAGNVDPTPPTWSWMIEASTPPIDSTPPQTSITSGPSGTTTATTANFTLSSNEVGSSFECKLDKALGYLQYESDLRGTRSRLASIRRPRSRSR